MGTDDEQHPAFGGGDGLIVWEGNYLSRSSESKLSWNLLRQLVDAYIEENVYPMPGEDILLWESEEEAGSINR